MLDVKNTAKKFLMDQTFGATANTVAFIAGVGALKGMGGAEIVDALRRVCVPVVILLLVRGFECPDLFFFFFFKKKKI